MRVLTPGELKHPRVFIFLQRCLEGVKIALLYVTITLVMCPAEDFNQAWQYLLHIGK